jgi:hypothetical protein
MWQLGIRSEIDPCWQVSPTMFYFYFIKILGIQSLSTKNSYEALQIPQKNHGCRLPDLEQLFLLEHDSILHRFSIKNSNSSQIWISSCLSLRIMLQGSCTHTLTKSKTFSAMYFCCSVAPLCCTLAGWMHNVAFLYCFLTVAPVIRSINDTAFHPHSGQSVQCQYRRIKLH